MKKASFFILTVLCIFTTLLSCSNDSDSTADYTGSWYRYQVNNMSTEMNVIVCNISVNSVEMVLYQVIGKELESSAGSITNVKKTTERYSLSVNGNIGTLSNNQESISLKYSIIDNQLVLTDLDNGNIYSLLRVTSEIQKDINNLEKIAL